MMKLKQKKQNSNKALSKKSASSSSFPVWVIPSVCVLFFVSFLSSLNNKTRSNNVSQISNSSLETTELDPSYAGHNQAKARAEAPYYGLQDQTVNQEQVIINLRDNGFQDGDLVTLSVNDRVIVASHFLLNKSTPIPVNLRPGVNVVEIYGVRDGMQNGMGISLAADVPGKSNSTSVLFPENATATFNIIRNR